MVNIVIPIVNNLKSYKKLLSTLNGAEDINVLVGVCSSMASQIHLNSENIFIIEFEDGSSRESMINSLQKYLVEGSVLILRKAITVDELYNFLKSKKDVVVCEHQSNVVVKFFIFLWQKILKMILGLKLYEGDTSVIFFNDEISSVLFSTNDLSFATRVDKWRGLEQSTVKVEGKAVKTDIDHKSILKFIMISILSLAVAVSVTVCVSIFVPVTIIIGLLLFCLDVICLSIFAIMMVLIIFNVIVGKKHFENAKEVNNNFVEDSDEDDIIILEGENENEEN